MPEIKKQFDQLKAAYDASMLSGQEAAVAYARFLRKLKTDQAISGSVAGRSAPFAVALRGTLFGIRSAGAVLAVLLLIFGFGSLTVLALPGMLPGDAFYGVKLATERAQSSLTFDPQLRTRLELEFASRRIEEAALVAQSDLPDRDARVRTAVEQFRHHISKTSSTLSLLQRVPDGEIIAVAKTVDRKVSEYDDVLERAATDASQSVQAELREARNELQDVSFGAVSVLLEKQQSGEVSSAELEAAVLGKLRDLEAGIQLVALRLSKVPSGAYPEISAIGGPTLPLLYQKIDSARSSLETAKNFFAAGGYEAALKHYRDGVGKLNNLSWAADLYERVLAERAAGEESGDGGE